MLSGDVLGGPTAIQAVSAGSVEAGLSSIPALINANAAGLPVVGICDIQTTFENQALQRWYVRSDSPIKTINDVSGQRYAVNLWRSSFHNTSLYALHTAGVDPEKVNWRLLSFTDQIAALEHGEIDVAGLIEPYQSFVRAEYSKIFRELFNDYDLYGEKQVSLIFVNRIWAEHNEETTRKFVRGLEMAIEWIEAHPEDAAEIVSAYTEIPREAIGAYYFTPKGEVREADIAWWLQTLTDLDMLTAEWLTPEMVGTNKYHSK